MLRTLLQRSVRLLVVSLLLQHISSSALSSRRVPRPVNNSIAFTHQAFAMRSLVIGRSLWDSKVGRITCVSLAAIGGISLAYYQPSALLAVGAVFHAALARQQMAPRLNPDEVMRQLATALTSWHRDNVAINVMGWSFEQLKVSVDQYLNNGSKQQRRGAVISVAYWLKHRSSDEAVRIRRNHRPWLDTVANRLEHDFIPYLDADFKTKGEPIPEASTLLGVLRHIGTPRAYEIFRGKEILSNGHLSLNLSFWPLIWKLYARSWPDGLAVTALLAAG